MKITLIEMTLRNFKGIRERSIKFSPTTQIFGKNKAGKTTIMDAFLWLMFGKDSTDRKTFEIKTLDANNQPYRKLEHEVMAIINIDGERTEVRRVFKEKWERPRGQQEDVFKGHVQEFYWNGVPMKENEFQKKVSELIDERIFKIVTNPVYFNSMKWQDMRSILESIAGEISEVDILMKLGYQELIASIQKKGLEGYRAELAAGIKNVKDKIKFLPDRIQEAKMALPEEADYDGIENQIKGLNKQIEDIDSLLNDIRNQANEHSSTINGYIAQKSSLQAKLSECKNSITSQIKKGSFERRSTIDSLKSQLNNANQERSRLASDKQSYEQQKQAKEQKVTELRAKYIEIDNSSIQFNDNDFCCPTCKRQFDADNIEAKKEELINNFNKRKSDNLASIHSEANALKENIAILEANINQRASALVENGIVIDKLNEDIATMEKEHQLRSAAEESDISAAILASEECKLIEDKIAGLDKLINAPFDTADTTEHTYRRRQLTEEVNALNRKLSTKDIREKQLLRIDELSNSESTMANELTELEGIQFKLMEFEKAKMQELEDRVNHRFKIAKFKLFEKQINGGEVPCCITLINGVPYSDANTAAKIQAGIDIINVLSEHYNAYAPIFVDNRESVTILPATDSQLISLVVSPDDETLRIEHAMAETALAD